MRRASMLLVIAVCSLLVFPLAASDTDRLQYTLPAGWVDLVDPAVDTSRFPANPVSEAKSGRYVIYAIDPDSLSPQGANATFNVVEEPRSGRVTGETVRKAINEAVAQAERLGYTMNILNLEKLKLGDVDIWVANSLLSIPMGTARLQQYFIPGKTKNATLTYACRPDLFDQYAPLFEASVMATRGAYTPSRLDLGGALRTSTIGAFFGGVAGLLIALIYLASRRGSRAPRSAVQTAAPSTWECSTCRRRVPVRVVECRCGTPRPA